MPVKVRKVKKAKNALMKTRTGSFRVPRSMSGFVRPVGAYGRFSGSPAEQKFIDVQVAPSPLANGPMIFQIDNILAIPTGTGPSERVGRKIKLTNLAFDISFVSQISAAQQYNRFRVRCWLDKQCNGVAAQTNDVYDPNVSPLVLGTQAPLNLFNEGRFVLLGEAYKTCEDSNELNMDITNLAIPNVNQSQVQLGFSTLYHCQMNIPLNVVIEYSGATGAIAEIRSNQIFVEVSSDYNGVSTVYRGNLRTRYTDV